MKQNNDFYDSLSQINKQIDLLKSISQTLAAGLYDQQQDLVLAALNLTTLENTKFSHDSVVHLPTHYQLLSVHHAPCSIRGTTRQT